MHHHIIAYLHTHHAYWYWALVWAICCFMMIDHVISHHPQFSIYRCIYICTMYLVDICIYPNTQCSIYMYTCIHMYIYIYQNTKYPIPNTKKGHQKIPFLLTSRHNSDLQSQRWNRHFKQIKTEMCLAEVLLWAARSLWSIFWRCTPRLLPLFGVWQGRVNLGKEKTFLYLQIICKI